MTLRRDGEISLLEMDSFTDFPSNKEGAVPGAYIIEHASGKFYVGSTGNLAQRKYQHTSGLALGNNPSTALQKAYNENPSVVFVAIPTNTKEDALKYEQSLLDAYIKTNLLFNTSPDARVAFKGLHHSDKTKDKLRQVNTGAVHSDAAKLKISLAGMGRVFSDETKDRISKAKTGWKPPENVLANLATANAERSVAVVVDGTVYSSVNVAASVFKVDNRTVDNRCRSTTGRFDNWKYKD